MTSSKRDHILEAATALARREGLGGLSVRAVASEAGVGATTVRNYFPSQAVLHQEVAGRFVTFALDELRIGDDEVPWEDRLVECVEQFLPAAASVVASLEGWLEYYRLSFGTDRIESVHELLLAGRRASAAALERWLQTLVDEGHPLQGPVAEQATTLLVLVDGMHLTMLTDPDRLELDGARALLRRHVATAVFA